MKTLEIKIKVKMSELKVLNSTGQDTKRVKWEILNREEIEEKISKIFKREIEIQLGRAVVSGGSWVQVNFPESVYVNNC